MRDGLNKVTGQTDRIIALSLCTIMFTLAGRGGEGKGTFIGRGREGRAP